MTCPHCDQAAEFHSHRTHSPLSLVGSVGYERAYYLCRRCGQGIFPFDEAAGLAARKLTPALERVASLAGIVADSFEKGAELLHEMAGVRLSGFFAFRREKVKQAFASSKRCRGPQRLRQEIGESVDGGDMNVESVSDLADRPPLGDEPLCQFRLLGT